jgi:hypothetical protein
VICTSCQILFKLEKNSWAGHVTCGRGEVHTWYWLESLIVRQFGRPRLRWEDNITMNFQDIGWSVY